MSTPTAVGSRLKAIAWSHSRRNSPSALALAGALSAQAIAINPAAAVSGLIQRGGGCLRAHDLLVT
jgi:hypothetical protein